MLKSRMLKKEIKHLHRSTKMKAAAYFNESRDYFKLIFDAVLIIFVLFYIN